MNKLLITGCLLATAFAAVAMPNKKELAAAQKRVEDIIAPDVKALNAGRKTVKDVADIQMKLAADAQSEAEKYLLLQSAFKLYSRGEEFDSAAKALTAITRDIKDVPPDLITELVDKEFSRDMGLKAPKEIEAVVSRIADSSVKVIHGKATVNGYTWSYRVNNGEAEIVSEKGDRCAVSPSPIGAVAIPSALGGLSVRSIGEKAFFQCGGLESVRIPECVTNIGFAAFAQCDGLKSVVLPPSVKSIGNVAFGSCNGLTSVTFPANLTCVNGSAFECCNELNRIVVDSGNRMFFEHGGVVYTKDLLTLVACPAGLASVKVLPGVTSIGTCAFRGCAKLASVSIPSCVTNIGRNAFWGCSGLKSITIPPAVTRIDSNVFRDCSGLTSVVIPSNVTSIGWCAFCDCNGLKSVSIPSGVTSIGGCAFFRCGELTSVMIPRGVTSIGKDAFYGCGGLSSVMMLGERPSATNNIFPRCGKLKSIHVPANAKSWAGMKKWQGIPLVFDSK